MRMLLHIIPFLVEYVRKQQKCAHLPSKSADHLPIQTGAMLYRSYTNISARSRFAPVVFACISQTDTCHVHTKFMMSDSGQVLVKYSSRSTI
jgi:hypothetical protein